MTPGNIPTMVVALTALIIATAESKAIHIAAGLSAKATVDHQFVPVSTSYVASTNEESRAILLGEVAYGAIQAIASNAKLQRRDKKPHACSAGHGSHLPTAMSWCNTVAGTVVVSGAGRYFHSPGHHSAARSSIVTPTH